MTAHMPVVQVGVKLVRLRPHTQNPSSPRCALHLRVVCGTCKYFGAERIRTHEPCARLGIKRFGGFNATGCGYWARKTMRPAPSHGSPEGRP